jgi:mannose-1-phosphate guanylyltransferase
VLRSQGGPLHIALDENQRVTDIRRKLSTTPKQEFLFTGIYVVEPEFFARIPAETKISVVPIFMEMIRVGAKLGGIVIDEGRWWDLGTRGQYLDVQRFFDSGKRIPDTGKEEEQSAKAINLSGIRYPLSGMCWVHPSAQVSPAAQLRGATAIGPHAKVGDGAVLTDCIVSKRGARTGSFTGCASAANR